MENPGNAGTPSGPENAGVPSTPLSAPKRSAMPLAIIIILGGAACAVAYFLPNILIEKQQEPPLLSLGGTQVASLMVDQWGNRFRKDKNPELRIYYGSTGSSDGINQMIEGKFLIGFAHDEMSEQQKKTALQKGGEVVQVPIALCGVVPIYNIRNLSTGPEPKKDELEKLAKDLSVAEPAKMATNRLMELLNDSKHRDIVKQELNEKKSKLTEAQAKNNLELAVKKAEEALAMPLNFTPDVLARIFLGEIKKWDHEDLKKLNPGALLPTADITVVYRNESSGTTQIFTDFLQGASKTWQEKIGKAGSTIKWPVGEGMKRSNDVAYYVEGHSGTIGYVDLQFAKARELDYGAVENKEHRFIHAEPVNLTAATKELIDKIPDNLSFKLTNKSGADTYPITGVVWAACYQNQRAENRKTLVDFLTFITHEGQAIADDKKFARLPPEITSRVDEKIKTIQAQ